MPKPSTKASTKPSTKAPAIKPAVAVKDPAGSPSPTKTNAMAPRRREDPACTSASSASSAASSPPASPPSAKDKNNTGRIDERAVDVDIDAHEDDNQDAMDVRAKSLSVDRSSRPHFKEGIRLAEMGKWSTLVERLALGETQLARHKDHHGMLPLHWACTEDDVPSEAVRALLAAFPEAVLTKNNAQYLPVHLAVRARVSAETLRMLAAARPSSLFVETPAGKTVLALAREVQLPPDAMSVLEHFEKEYLDLSADSDDDDNAQLEHAKRDYAAQSQRLRESMLHPPSLSTNDLRSGSNAGRGNAANGQHDSGYNLSFDANFGPLDMMNASFGPTDAIAGDIARASGQSFHSQSSNSAPMVTSLSFVGGALVHHQQKDSLRIEEEVATPGGSLAAPQHAQSSRGAPRPGGAVPLPSRSATSRGFHGDHNPFATPFFDTDAHDSGVCGVCYKKFGVFRKKYQCKSCFAYLCKKHVAGKVVLPSFAKKRSVCGDCYRMHRNGPVPVTLPGASSNNSHNHNGAATASSISTSNSSKAVQPANGNSISGPLRPHTGTGLSARSVSVASSNGSRSQSHSNGRKPSNGTANVNDAANQQQQRQGQPQELHHALPQDQLNRSALGNSMLVTRSVRAESTHSIVGRPSTVVGPQTSMRYSTTNARTRGQSSALSGAGAPRARNNSSLLLADRPHSETTASFSDGDPTSASMLLRASMASMQEVAVLNQRIATLEECNKLLLTRVANQEKQYDEAMLLLTQTMTRVAEMEMRVPDARKSYRGTGGSTTASERASELLEADIKFSFPTPFTEKFD